MNKQPAKKIKITLQDVLTVTQKGFERIDTRFDEMDKRMDGLELKIDKVDYKVSGLSGRVEVL